MFKKENDKVNFTVINFDILPSTNEYIEKNINALTGDTVVIAKEQTSGQGTNGRNFVSQKGGIYISFLIKRNQKTTDLSLLTPCVAVLVKRAIKKATGVDVGIKWVNDLYLGGKKICGILCKTHISENGVSDWQLVGIGINANVTSFPPEISDIATSLQIENKKHVNISKITKYLIEEMSSLPKRLVKKDFIEEYRSCSVVIGKKVKLKEKQVKVLSVNEDCSCTVEHEDGTRETLNHGEIILY